MQSTVSIVTVEIIFMVIFVIMIQLVKYTCGRHYVMINTVRDRCGALFIMVLIQLVRYLSGPLYKVIIVPLVREKCGLPCIIIVQLVD